MFDFLFGWRKASACKRLIRRMECRLKLLVSKRCAIVRQVKDDVALLLKVGHDQTIFTRVEQLYMDEIIITVYELLGHFCQFISINLPCIRRHHKHCPNDVNEAISSLIFASARCGDVPELRNFRELIEAQYGQRYVRTALDLLPGNLVNDQIKEKLSITSVSDDAKVRMVNEILRDYCLRSAIQYRQEWHEKQAKENSISSGYALKQTSYLNEVPRDETKSASASKSVSEDCFSLPTNDLANNNQAAILPAQGPLMVQKLTEMDNLAHKSHMPSSSSSCSDISVHLTDDNLVYLDDVEELRSPKLYDCSAPDTRVFMFKSSPSVNVQSEFQSRMRGRLRRTRSRKVRKMSSSMENANLGQNVEFMDVACNKNHDSSTELRRERLPRMVLKDVNEPFSGKRGKFQSQVSNGVNLLDDIAIPRNNHLQNHDQIQHSHYEYQPDPVAEQARGINKQNEVMKKRVMGEDNLRSPKSSNGSNSVGSAPANKSVALTCYVKDAETHYLRAFTLPTPQRPKDQGLEIYSRASSLPVPPKYVHPKLPDYEQIEAKFSALKQVYQHTQCH